MEFKNEWIDGFPDSFDRSQAISQYNQHLFENWKRNEGPCAGCPNYALKKKCFPSFGKGSGEAEIMIIGNSPGPRSRSLEINNKGRKIDPDKLDSYPEFDGYPLASFYNYGIEDINNWSGISTLRKRLIEHSNGLDTDLSSNEIYFTNAKKCTNIMGRDNKAAVSNCNPFLEKEIEILDPSVIISWGLQAATGAAKAVGYDIDQLPQKSTALPQGDIQPIDSCIGIRETGDRFPCFITMPHWGLLGPNVNHIPGFDSSQYERPEIQLYYELASLIEYLSQ